MLCKTHNALKIWLVQSKLLFHFDSLSKGCESWRKKSSEDLRKKSSETQYGLQFH